MKIYGVRIFWNIFGPKYDRILGPKIGVNLYDSNQNCGVGSQKSKGVGSNPADHLL
jgi:hypothetical protein